MSTDRVAQSVRGPARTWWLVALVVLFAPPAAHAQQVGGLVAEQGTLAPVPDAVVTLYRVVADDGELEPAGTAVTGDDGAFLFLPSEPGSYRLQADFSGLSSPVSHPIDVGPAEGRDDLVLLVPSPLLMLAATCDQEEEPGAVAVGTVRDRETDVPLPGVRVTARWEGDGGSGERSVESDGRGHYRICGLEPGGFVRMRAESLGRESGWDEFELPRPAMIFHDMELQVIAPGGADGEMTVSEFLLMEMAGTLGDLRGELRDRSTGEPVRQAVVRLRGTGFQGVTDSEGRFAFLDLQPGEYTIEVQHLGYSVQTSAVEVPRGRDVFVRFELSPQAIQLEGIEVTARARIDDAVRMSPTRRDIIAGGALAEAEVRGATPAEVLRSSVPGLRVTEGSGGSLCIQPSRGTQTLGGGCQMVLVVLDDTRITDGAQFLRGLALADVESIEFIPGTQATTRWGTAAANGVVLIYSRGRGPYVSPTRDR